MHVRAVNSAAVISNKRAGHKTVCTSTAILRAFEVAHRLCVRCGPCPSISIYTQSLSTLPCACTVQGVHACKQGLVHAGHRSTLKHVAHTLQHCLSRPRAPGCVPQGWQPVQTGWAHVAGCWRHARMTHQTGAVHLQQQHVWSALTYVQPC